MELVSYYIKRSRVMMVERWNIVRKQFPNASNVIPRMMIFVYWEFPLPVDM
jgi:hypothetical protein